MGFWVSAFKKIKIQNPLKAKQKSYVDFMNLEPTKNRVYLVFGLGDFPLLSLKAAASIVTAHTYKHRICQMLFGT